MRGDELTPKNHLIVGVLGGIASGKSLVTRLLAKMGGEILNADQIAHEILSQEATVREIVRRFGESVLADHERPQVDRKKMAALVFGDSEHHYAARQQLESVLQPLIRHELLHRIERWKSAPTAHFLILDIPLLVEREWYKLCDHILFVDTPRERRVEFARQRGWTEKQVADREATQMPLHEKKKFASFVLKNDGTEQELVEQLQKWFSTLEV